MTTGSGQEQPGWVQAVGYHRSGLHHQVLQTDTQPSRGLSVNPPRRLMAATWPGATDTRKSSVRPSSVIMGLSLGIAAVTSSNVNRERGRFSAAIRPN
jgi:hypothetical protein